MYCGEFRKHRYMNIIWIKKKKTKTHQILFARVSHIQYYYLEFYSLVYFSACIYNLLCKKGFHNAYKALHTLCIYNVSMLGMYVIFTASRHLLNIITIVEAIPTSRVLPVQAKVEVTSIFQPRSCPRCSRLHQQPVPIASGFSDGKESTCNEGTVFYLIINWFFLAECSII